MTPSTPVHKYKALLGSLLLATVLILSNICTYTVANKKDNNEESAEPITERPSYRVSYFSSDPSVHVKRLVPTIWRLEDDALQDKIEENLKATFMEWMPGRYMYPQSSSIRPALSTEKYVSIMIVCVFKDRDRQTELEYVCNTFDLTTGETLYLDDIIEVDDELASLILTEGAIQVDYDILSGEHDTEYPLAIMGSERPARVLEQLKLCSVPFGEYEWSHKPTFYLEKNRLYFLNVFSEGDCFYIEQDKISHKLKVEPW